MPGIWLRQFLWISPPESIRKLALNSDSGRRVGHQASGFILQHVCEEEQGWLSNAHETTEHSLSQTRQQHARKHNGGVRCHASMLLCFIDISIPVFHVILIECYHDTD